MIAAQNRNVGQSDEGTSRPQMGVMGTSRNPDYNVAIIAPHFKRHEDGKRMAPVSQLNTYTGRLLAPKYPKNSNNTRTPSRTEDPSELRQRARSQNRDASVRQSRCKREQSAPPAFHSRRLIVASAAELVRERSTSLSHRHNNSDRNLLPSQRPRIEVPQSRSMTSGSSRKGAADGPKEERKDWALAAKVGPPCLECGQSGIDSKTTSTRGFSHICSKCQRFVPGATVTALQPPTPPLKEQPLAPIPPTKAPAPIKCTTCLAIPGYLQGEYPQFLPTCPSCKQMSHMTLCELVERLGEVQSLTDDQGRLLFGPSKELQDWCVHISNGAHDVARQSNNKLLAQRITNQESLRLKRTDSLKHNSPSSTASSNMSAGSGGSTEHFRLTAVSEVGGKNVNYTKRFGFDAIPETVTPLQNDATGVTIRPLPASPSATYQRRQTTHISKKRAKTSSTPEAGIFSLRRTKRIPEDTSDTSNTSIEDLNRQDQPKIPRTVSEILGKK